MSCIRFVFHRWQYNYHTHLTTPHRMSFLLRFRALLTALIRISNHSIFNVKSQTKTNEFPLYIWIVRLLMHNDICKLIFGLICIVAICLILGFLFRLFLLFIAICSVFSGLQWIWNRKVVNKLKQNSPTFAHHSSIKWGKIRQKSDDENCIFSDFWLFSFFLDRVAINW